MVQIINTGLIIAFLGLASGDTANAMQPGPKVGDKFEIVRSYEKKGPAGYSGGHDTFVEEVIAVKPEGLELEYDTPQDLTEQQQSSSWQLPARVFLGSDGSMDLLNRDEMEERVDRWLDAAGWTREACGHWIFTWNVFQIECDPQSVIVAFQELDLRSLSLTEGGAYSVPEARAPGGLLQKSITDSGLAYTAVMDVDPAAVQRARAESDVVVGGILGKPITLEDALAKRSKETIEGKITVTFDADSEGSVWRRTEVTEITTITEDGEPESSTTTETIERRQISG